MKNIFYSLQIIPVILAFLTVSASSSLGERSKPLIPQSCLNILSIKANAQKLKWTLRPGKGPKGSVRFIHQTILSNNDQVLLSVEKKEGDLYLSQKKRDQIHFYRLNLRPDQKCQIQFLRSEKEEGKSTTTLKKDEKDSEAFDDHDLEKLLKGSKVGIIYLWSPHMPYSIGSLYPLQKVSNKLGLKLIVLMDPLAEQEETKKVIKQFSLPMKLTKKNKAKKLLFHGAALHYPNYFFYKEGKVSHIQLFGAKGEQAIHDALKKLASK